jgi:hypothetical protein
MQLSGTERKHLRLYNQHSRVLESTDPFVPPLHFESTFLPVGFILDVCLENHLFLSWDIVHNDCKIIQVRAASQNAGCQTHTLTVKDLHKVSTLCLEELEHSRTEFLKFLKGGSEIDLEDKALGNWSRTANVRDTLVLENEIADEGVLYSQTEA